MDGCDSGKPGIEACWPIPVSPDDPDFGHTNRCIKFVRSEPAPPLDCGVGELKNVNGFTLNFFFQIEKYCHAPRNVIFVIEKSRKVFTKVMVWAKTYRGSVGMS